MFAYRSILQEQARPAAIRESTTFGISLMALALHLGTQSSQVGNHGYAAHHGYPGAEQARPAFIVLAVVAATAATIALAGRAGARTDKRAGKRAGRASQGGGPVRCRSLRET